MDSKYTKGIRRPSIKKALNRTAPASSIAGPFQESKSTSINQTYWAHQRGWDSESRVIEYYLKAKYQLISQRLKTPFAEIDLLFLTPDGHKLIVEVKTVNLSDFMSYRISKRQKERLLRALLFLSHEFNCLVEIHWAFVTINGEVTIVEDICG